MNELNSLGNLKTITGKILSSAVRHLIRLQKHMITIISGTNRPNSYTLKLAQIYKDFFEQGQQACTILSLSELPDNVLFTDMYGSRSQEFAKIQQLITESDKLVFILPEYNGSFPGIAKVFVDCCDFPGCFQHKKAALVGLSSGKYGNIRGLDHFTGVCHYLGLQLLPLKIHIANIRKEINPEGLLHQEDTLKFVKDQVQQLIEF